MSNIRFLAENIYVSNDTWTKGHNEPLIKSFHASLSHEFS